MITASGIENFKAIRDRVRIDLRAISLLFGPNSGGTCTAMHAGQPDRRWRPAGMEELALRIAYKAARKFEQKSTVS
jgi:hypothetical protein